MATSLARGRSPGNDNKAISQGTEGASGDSQLVRQSPDKEEQLTVRAVKGRRWQPDGLGWELGSVRTCLWASYSPFSPLASSTAERDDNSISHTGFQDER